MPKMKTNRAVAKRLKRTGSGKLVAGHAMKRHILTKKSRARKRALGRKSELSPGDSSRLRRIVPYI